MHLTLGLDCNYWEKYCTLWIRAIRIANDKVLALILCSPVPAFCNSEKWRPQSMTLQISWWFSRLFEVLKLKSRKIVGHRSMKQRTGNIMHFLFAGNFRPCLARKEGICCLFCMGEVYSNLWDKHSFKDLSANGSLQPNRIYRKCARASWPFTLAVNKSNCEPDHFQSIWERN